MTKAMIYDSNYELISKAAILLNTEFAEVLDEIIDNYFDEYISEAGISKEDLDRVEEY